MLEKHSKAEGWKQNRFGDESLCFEIIAEVTRQRLFIRSKKLALEGTPGQSQEKAESE